MTERDDARPTRSLDRKLASILAGEYTPDDFILADAKDADMAFGLRRSPRRTCARPGPLRHPGRVPRPHARARGPGRARHPADVGLQRRASGSPTVPRTTRITLAVRGNDTTDMWNLRGGAVPDPPSRPFAHRRPRCRPRLLRPACSTRSPSTTNSTTTWRPSRPTRAFRREAAEHRHAALPRGVQPQRRRSGLAPEDIGAFVNDWIVRTLAGVTQAERPLFLKMAYNGADAVAELAEHDPSIVVGILGGSAGTTRDTFELLHAV